MAARVVPVTAHVLPFRPWLLLKPVQISKMLMQPLRSVLHSDFPIGGDGLVNHCNM
jgi:hypothetical protein